MKIAEIYRSVQGEGFLTGTESTFVRASGCNLRCWYCDTPYASWNAEGDDLSVEEIVSQVDELACDHVVLTGGEPMLFAEAIPLTEALTLAGLHVTVETAGTLYLPVQCDLMSISPKLAGSAPGSELAPRWNQRHEQTRHAPEVIRRLVREYPYQMKFVIDTLADCDDVDRYLEAFPELTARVMLMPQGCDLEALNDRAAWLEPYCQQNGLHFCPRRQIEWFGFVRGT